MKKLISLLFACIAFTTIASAQVLLLQGDYPDPSVVKDGEDYYMTHSPNYYKPGFLIWHSRDLMKWEPIAHAATDWAESAWAPDFQKVGDTFYIYFPSNGTNWVITAQDVHGPWSEPIDLKIGGIDPGLVVTPEGKRYLFTNMGNVTPLTDDGLARAGETKRVYTGWRYPAEWATECGCLEAPKIIYRDGYYYMTSAMGGTAGPATSHMAISARAKDIYGPWENSPYNPIVHTYSASEEWWSKGHGSVVEGPDGQWWIIYHGYRKGAHAIGRSTLMEPIEWTKGGWYRPVKDMEIDQTEPNKIDISDSFDSDQFSWQWAGWRENITKIASLKKGAAVLPARGEKPHEGHLMIASAPNYRYAIETQLTLGKKGNEAGMILYYSAKAYAGVMCNGETLTIYKNATDVEQIPNKFGRSVYLKLENGGEKLNVLASADGKKWEMISEGIDIKDMHHNKLGDFISLRPALCSTGEDEAKFHYFNYTPSE